MWLYRVRVRVVVRVRVRVRVRVVVVVRVGVKRAPPWQRPISAPAPPQAAPGGFGQLSTPRRRAAHWAPRRCLGCLSLPPPSQPPPKPPIPP